MPFQYNHLDIPRTLFKEIGKTILKIRKRYERSKTIKVIMKNTGLIRLE